MSDLRIGRRVLDAIVAALLLAPPLARAGEEAGTMSPFARGAGARAAAMGGAFVAAADDASALTWNPAGLVRIDRLTLEADYARFEESETGEHFAAMVTPSWRWGVASLTLRHLGVTGVERRDARNVLLGDLSAGETELALGYARTLAPGVGVGGAVKLQRLGIGERAGTGTGADLGLVLEARPWIGERWTWAAPFALGLAVRNALEPAQRLDHDAVPDPRLVRMGLAWRRELAGAATLQLATDLEHGGAPSARLRAGAELSLGGILSLRTGLDQGHLAAGTGLLWQGFSFDYVYEQRDLGSIQRIGLSKAIGPTVTQSRDAARVDQERDLTRRLDQAYLSRQREQVAGFLTRAEAARASGDLDAALEAIAIARALAPEDSKLAALESKVLRAEGERLEAAGDVAGAEAAYGRALEVSPADSLAAAGRQRARLALDRLSDRSRHAGAMSEAYRLFGAGDLTGAREAFRRLSGAAPADSEGAAMLRRVESMIAQRIASRLAGARRDMAGGHLDDAARGLEEARALGASEAELAGVRATLDAERRRAVERPAPSAPPPTASPKGPSEAKRREADQLYRRGVASSAARDPDAALRFWELSLTIDPGHAGARSALRNEYLLRGMAAFGRGRFTEAEAHWRRVLELDPNDARARGYLQRARTQIERTRELTDERP